MKWTNRLSRVISAGAIALVLGWVGLQGSASAQAVQTAKYEKKVVIGIFGGNLGQQLRTVIDGFAKPLGVETVYVEGTSNGLLAKARAQRDAPQMDLFVGNDQTFALAKTLGLLSKLDPAIVTNLQYVRPGYKDPDGFGQFYEINPVGFVYRTDKLAEAGVTLPAKWTLLSDPRLKGRVTLFSPTVSFGFHYLIGLALSAGKNEEDISPAWQELPKDMANGATVVTTPGQVDAMATRGETWLYVSSAVRAKLAKEQGAPIGFSIPVGAPPIAFPNFMGTVRNAQHPLIAQMIVNYMIGKQAQTEIATTGAIVPVNTQVELSPDLKQRLGFAPDKPLPEIHVLNVDAINAHLDEWVEKFNREVSR